MKGPDPLLLSRLRPEWSAHIPLTMGQKVVGLLILAGVTTGLVLAPLAAGRVLVAICTVYYVAFTLYKFMLVRLSVSQSAEIRVPIERLAELHDEDLPRYSILVPLYHEPETVVRLVESIQALDYPANRKDVQLLLEEDDGETRAAVAAMRMPPGFRVTLIPRSHPRTKPKACNIGLALARGKYLVIYDAEDRPEPDQLKKAVIGFRQADDRVICLQSKLNYYNPRQNLLTRWFTAEYSAWFDLFLPGLAALNAVIPLGGTSNHFITRPLRSLLGWDAYNVTEDCDLGIRIYRAGYRTQMLDTTTWEEACGRLSFWIRQRTRWLKGYLQTYLVHMRQPVRLLRELGLSNFLHFQVLIGGLVFGFVINPLFWIMTLLWFVFRVESLSLLFPGMVFLMGALCLFAGNFTFAYIGAVGCYRRACYDLVKYALVAPVYWCLMSVSAWRAVWQFFRNPFLWEKTRHGFFAGT